MRTSSGSSAGLEGRSSRGAFAVDDDGAGAEDFAVSAVGVFDAGGLVLDGLSEEPLRRSLLSGWGLSPRPSSRLGRLEWCEFLPDPVGDSRRSLSALSCRSSLPSRPPLLQSDSLSVSPDSSSRRRRRRVGSGEFPRLRLGLRLRLLRWVCCRRRCGLLLLLLLLFLSWCRGRSCRDDLPASRCRSERTPA